VSQTLAQGAGWAVPGCTVTWRVFSRATGRGAGRVSDTAWLTYDELAERLGIGRESARRLVLRKHWVKRKENDGKARIGVPGEALSRDDPRHAPRLVAGHDTGGVTPDVARQAQPDPVLQVKIRELETAFEGLKALVAEANKRAEEAARRADQADGRAAELREERDRWAVAAEAGAQQVSELLKRRSWWPWRRSA
jgi:hypothetical protein